MKAAYLVFFSILVALLATGCQIKSFEAPTWDVNLNVPLINHTYFVSDLIDSLHFFPGPDNALYVQSDGSFRTNPLDHFQLVLVDPIPLIQLHSIDTEAGTIPVSQVQDTIRISYGVIAEGQLNYSFSNMSNSIDAAYVVFPDLTDAANDPLTIDYNSIPGQQHVSLVGYKVGTPGSDILLTDLRYELHVQSSLPQGAIAGNLQLGMDHYVAFSMIRGRVTSYRIDMAHSDAQVDLEYPTGIEDAVDITEGRIIVNVHNPFSFACLMHGDIYGKNDKNEEVTISIPPRSINASTDSSGYSRIEFTDNVNQLLNVMPTFVELRNAYFSIYNPFYRIGELNSDSLITGTYTVQTPLTFSILTGSIIPKDSVRIEISEDNREQIKKNINTVQLKLLILNQLPIGAKLTLYFSEQANFNPDNPTEIRLSKLVHVIAMAGSNPEQEFMLQLSSEEKQVFEENQFVYMRMKAEFDAPPDNQPVHITASSNDFIRVRGMLGINATVNPKDN